MFGVTFHRRAFLVLLTLLGGCMVTSIGMANVMWVLLLANWLLEGRWHEKWALARSSRLLAAVAALFLLHVVGLAWTSNLPQGFHVVERLLPLMAVSLVVLTTRPPQGRPRSVILALYMGTVAVVSAIGFVRWLTIPDLPYRDIVPFISHIRFALNCCMVVFLAVFAPRFFVRGRWGRVEVAVRVVLVVWMLAFLFLLRSYTAFAVLLLASLVAACSSRRRWLWVTVWVAVAGGMAAYVAVEYDRYYRLQPVAQQPLAQSTANGRPYEHHQDGFVENGNFVNNYLCYDELRSEWLRRSGIPFDHPTSAGFTVGNSLVRYLNALGLPKDSVGVATLTDAQVAEIAAGVSNPVFRHGSLPKRMLHVLFFEYESYRCYHSVAGFSMLQRMELWRTALHIVERHPWCGVGTGDLCEAMEDDFRACRSPLEGSGLMPHNEYLTLMALLGLPLFALLTLLFLRATPRLRHQPLVMALWLLAILVSCLTENTIDSLAGILFSTWFLAFRRD
ncbi:MAG: O-antigen ligase family protein [Bacteroidales bacterium]|nr:O-antigen ligase family protein [Bacteroidales bacterium]